MKIFLALALAVLAGCSHCHHEPTPAPVKDATSPKDAPLAKSDAAQVPGPKIDAALPVDAAPVGTVVTLTNTLPGKVKIYVAFGADSDIQSSDWSSWCMVTAPLNCEFDLTGAKVLPISGAYLNATFSAGLPVGCGATKAELNVNNLAWYDTVDISLVDGFNTNIEIDQRESPSAPKTILGPTKGATGNENVFGAFPLGCDVCVARQSPPCGMKLGVTGCKAGTQYNPQPVCQFQGGTRGGGGTIDVRFMGAPAAPQTK